MLGALAAILWILAIGVGLERIWRFENTPGPSGPSPHDWPGSALVTPRPGTFTLVMFVHPRCSCSRASLDQLKTIMERAGDRVAAWVLLMRPDGGAQDWDRTPARAAAARIPNAAIATDEDGTEAARFGALTSGHVAVFDPDGRLVFSGGITSARGHAGDNTGRQHVLDLVQGRAVAAADHAVFGCAIHDHDPLASAEEVP